MTRMPLFNSPFLLGFDQLERALDRVSKASADGYPPYNVEQIGVCSNWSKPSSSGLLNKDRRDMGDLLQRANATSAVSA